MTAFVDAPWEVDERERFVGLFAEMLRIRRFEDLVQALFLRGEVYGTTHLCSGQEAVAVGVASVLGEDDRIAVTYRGHGQALAIGIGIQEMLDELMGRATGVNGGRAGSMNIAAPGRRLLGTFGIIGGSIAAATGAALALRGSGAIAVAFFGEGAVNQAYFHECVNFASVFALPVVFVCENNVYSEYTLSSQVSGGEVCARAEAMGVPAARVNGMAVWEVRDAATVAARAARAGEGPRLLEAVTYRFVGHNRSDPGRYRPEGELDAWRERDPLTLCRARLEVSGVTPEELEAIERSVEEEIVAAEAAGLAAPWPEYGTVPSQFIA